MPYPNFLPSIFPTPPPPTCWGICWLAQTLAREQWIPPVAFPFMLLLPSQTLLLSPTAHFLFLFLCGLTGPFLPTSARSG